MFTLLILHFPDILISLFVRPLFQFNLEKDVSHWHRLLYIGI